MHKNDLFIIKEENSNQVFKAVKLFDAQCEHNPLAEDIHKEYNIMAMLLEEVLMQDKIDKDQLLEILNSLVGIKKIVKESGCEIDKCTQNHPGHMYDVFTHTIKVIEGLPKDCVLRTCALFHDIGKYICKDIGYDGFDHFYGHEKESATRVKPILTELAYSDKFIDKVVKLIEHHDTQTAPTIDGVKEMASILGKEDYRLLLKMQRADLLAHSKPYIKRKIPVLERIEDIFKQIYDLL